MIIITDFFYFYNKIKYIKKILFSNILLTLSLDRCMIYEEGIKLLGGVCDHMTTWYEGFFYNFCGNF